MQYIFVGKCGGGVQTTFFGRGRTKTTKKTTKKAKKTTHQMEFRGHLIRRVFRENG